MALSVKALSPLYEQSSLPDHTSLMTVYVAMLWLTNGFLIINAIAILILGWITGVRIVPADSAPLWVVLGLSVAGMILGVGLWRNLPLAHMLNRAVVALLSVGAVLRGVQFLQAGVHGSLIATSFVMGILFGMLFLHWIGWLQASSANR